MTTGSCPRGRTVARLACRCALNRSTALRSAVEEPLRMNSMQNTPAKVWDLPTRVFHWLLAVLILLQYGTAEWHWLNMQWHVRFGYATLALLLFRVMWGFVGSQTSRFSDFVRGPRRAWTYARELLANRASFNIGHNP